jgi:hypothetical protein
VIRYGDEVVAKIFGKVPNWIERFGVGIGIS